MGEDQEMLRRSAALFLLKLKDEHKISQRAVDDIVFHSKSLLDARIKVGVHSQLASAGINFDEVAELNDVFSQVCDPFDTCYKQEKYFTEHLGLIVSNKVNTTVYYNYFPPFRQEPIEIKLLDKDTGDIDGVYHYIPLISTLESLLRREDIREQVNIIE